MGRGLLVLIVSLAFAGAARAAPPDVDARAYTVVNASTGTVLASSDAHVQLPIASITKLMTAIVALKHLRPDDEVAVTAKAARVGESRIPLRPARVPTPRRTPVWVRRRPLRSSRMREPTRWTLRGDWEDDMDRGNAIAS